MNIVPAEDDDDADAEVDVGLLDAERTDCKTFGAGIAFTVSLSGVEHAGLPSESAPQHRHSLSVNTISPFDQETLEMLAWMSSRDHMGPYRKLVCNWDLCR